MLVHRSVEGILGDNQIGKTATQLIKALLKFTFEGLRLAVANEVNQDFRVRGRMEDGSPLFKVLA